MFLTLLLWALKITKSTGKKPDLPLPKIEQLGPITKWMSEPPMKTPTQSPLTESYFIKNTINKSNRRKLINWEVQRMGDRTKTLAYRPNIEMINSQNCFCLNFGWPATVSLPSISISLNSIKDKH